MIYVICGILQLGLTSILYLFLRGNRHRIEKQKPEIKLKISGTYSPTISGSYTTTKSELPPPPPKVNKERNGCKDGNDNKKGDRYEK